MSNTLPPNRDKNQPPDLLKQRITARALLEAKRLGDPRLHPDGRHVAFVVTEADFEESRWVSHLWLTEWRLPGEEEADEEAVTDPVQAGEASEGAASESGEEEDAARQLTYSYEGETRPRWSPDGRWLAFLSARPDPSAPPEDEDDEEEPKEQLWILPVEGGEARRLTHMKEGVPDYAWTPDSLALVFLAPEPRPRPLESVRKENIRRKNDPVVAHDEKLKRQFWRIGVEERKPKLLFTADFGVSEFFLSPNGERICYATNYTGEWNDYHRVDLWIYDLPTGRRAKLAERAGGKYNARWSPDGAQIAFLSWLDPLLSYSRLSLYIADVPAELPEGQSEESLAAPAVSSCRLLAPETFDVELTEFAWSRHDGRIVAIAAAGTTTELYAVDRDGVSRLEAGPPAEREEIDLDEQSGVAVTIQQDRTSLEEVMLRDEQGAIHRLTRLNAGFSESHLLPRQEVVRWQSADGTPVEGVLTYPLDYEAGRPVPLIVQIHGGPKGRSTDTLSSYGMPPVWSAEGYAVLQPNYRGSEGYGNAFAIANRRDLGGGDFADILAGVEWCIEEGIADPERLGIMGGSYGGYMTNWAIGHTDRFKAAVSMFGIFHLQTDYSNSDLSRWDNDYLGAYYWEDPDIYRRLSPGSYIENIRTPTLILHGDDDNNTFISNSKEMYQALRHRGVTTQFVRYPREGHGIREPAHKLDEARRCLAWMDRYVRHGGNETARRFRIGDKVPGMAGQWELLATRAEAASLIGQAPEPKGSPPESATVLLEIVLTLTYRGNAPAPPSFTAFLGEIRLETQAAEGSAGAAFAPIGVPLDAPGGKVLVEGENLRIVQRPDEETQQLAFAVALIFRVLKRSGDGLLRVPGFPPVAVAWPASEDEENESREPSSERE